MKKKLIFTILVICLLLIPIVSAFSITNPLENFFDRFFGKPVMDIITGESFKDVTGKVVGEGDLKLVTGKGDAYSYGSAECPIGYTKISEAHISSYKYWTALGLCSKVDTIDLKLTTGRGGAYTYGEADCPSGYTKLSEAHISSYKYWTALALCSKTDTTLKLTTAKGGAYTYGSADCPTDYTKLSEAHVSSYKYWTTIGLCAEPEIELCVPAWKCKDSTTKAYLNEDCSWSSETTCDYGCEQGACVEPPVVECTDSDGGENYYEQGILIDTNGNTHIEFCYDDYPDMVEEYSCNFNPDSDDLNINSYWYYEEMGFYKIAYNCPNGCENGACLIPPPEVPTECTDTDGGNFPTIYGECYSTETGTFYEGCVDSSVLSEAYCSGGRCERVEVPCQYGCENGACVGEPEEPGLFCGDGICSNREEEIGVGNYIKDPITNKEVVLENVGSSGAILVSVEGFVETIPASNTKIVDGVSVTNKETFYSDVKSERSAILIVGESELSCLEDCGDEEEEIYCEDTDITEEYPDGKNYYTQGTLTAANTIGSKTDYCSFYTDVNKNLLHEYYCLDATQGTIEDRVDCPYGCDDGACLLASEESYCGDGTCDPDETYETCSNDCEAPPEEEFPFTFNIESKYHEGDDKWNAYLWYQKRAGSSKGQCYGHTTKLIDDPNAGNPFECLIYCDAGHYWTYVYVKITKTIPISLSYGGSGEFYLNDGKINALSGAGKKTANINLRKGWNKIKILIGNPETKTIQIGDRPPLYFCTKEQGPLIFYNKLSDQVDLVSSNKEETITVSLDKEDKKLFASGSGTVKREDGDKDLGPIKNFEIEFIYALTEIRIKDNNDKVTVWVYKDHVYASAYPKCKDGTDPSKCSITGEKPKYCTTELELIDDCQKCGCNSGTCHDNGECLQCKNTYAQKVGEDTKCNSAWPTSEGEWFMGNTGSHSCNIFEVCSADLDYVIKDAEDCCTGENKEGALCEWARENSQRNRKRCKGLYIIKGVGSYAKYMQGYFDAEWCCFAPFDPDKGYYEKYLFAAICPDINVYGGKCQPYFGTNPNIKALPCTQEYPPFMWGSDEDMSKNTCMVADLPAHVSVNILKTGTCVDYSIVLTTLLRKAGYEVNEVMSVDGTAHWFNLVKLPGDKKYHFVDTTENYLGDIIFYNTPPMDSIYIDERFEAQGGDFHFKGDLVYDYCKLIETGCFNDKGKVECPSSSEIYGCEVSRRFPIDRLSFDFGYFKGHCDSAYYEYKSAVGDSGPRIRVCCRYCVKAWPGKHCERTCETITQRDILGHVN